MVFVDMRTRRLRVWVVGEGVYTGMYSHISYGPPSSSIGSSVLVRGLCKRKEYNRYSV